MFLGRHDTLQGQEGRDAGIQRGMASGRQPDRQTHTQAERQLERQTDMNFPSQKKKSQIG